MKIGCLSTQLLCCNVLRNKVHMVPGSPSAEVSPSLKWKGCRKVSYILGANDLECFLCLIHFGNGTPGKSGNPTFQ